MDWRLLVAALDSVALPTPRLAAAVFDPVRAATGGLVNATLLVTLVNVAGVWSVVPRAAGATRRR